MLDFEFMALTICAVFGWTLPQVFCLTIPQFFKVCNEAHRVQYQRAKNEVYFGVCAALGNEENRKDLFDSAGSFCLDDGDVELPYTDEELRIAEERMAQVLEQRRKEEEEKNSHV